MARQALTFALAGLIIGVVIGLLIGRVGVAAMGDAFGIPAAVVLGIVGAAVGYHFGRVRDLKRPK
ncbi:MAG: hypothetical protein ACRED5_20135 [Propylenella sp.]